MAAPPALQIAQILADLSDLNVADPDAALALTTAHKNPSTASTNGLSSSGKRSDSHSNLQRMLSDSARESGMRLRFMGPRSSPSPTGRHGSPSLSRQMSSLGGSVDEELEPDLARASKLISLYETRGRFKQQENNGLARARANVEEVKQRYSKVEN